MLSASDIKKENKKEGTCLDLNCDIAQGYGVYRNDIELSLLPYVSSVNISCGSHSGDPITIAEALKVAKDNNLSIGAHIGYPDIQGFGYRDMKLDDDELEALVLYQIGALSSLAKAYRLEVEQVRPHGALYKQSALNFRTASVIAKAIRKYNPWLIYVCAAGENLAKAGDYAGIRTAGEVFLDKKYRSDGNIDFVSGNMNDFNFSLRQLNSLLRDNSLINEHNGRTKVDFKTIHLNMNYQYSVNLAQKANELIDKLAPISITMVKDTGWV